MLGPKSAGPNTRDEETEIHVHLGGLTAKKDRSKDVHLNWIPHTPLKVGDEIKIRIVEAAKADKPVKRPKPVNRAARDKSERETYESAKQYYLANRAKYEPDAV
jgi:hypothetical protein